MSKFVKRERGNGVLSRWFKCDSCYGACEVAEGFCYTYSHTVSIRMEELPVRELLGINSRVKLAAVSWIFGPRTQAALLSAYKTSCRCVTRSLSNPLHHHSCLAGLLLAHVPNVLREMESSGC
eukprot:1144410-Pelagomonas_calceolata.AAC.1